MEFSQQIAWKTKQLHGSTMETGWRCEGCGIWSDQFAPKCPGCGARGGLQRARESVRQKPVEADRDGAFDKAEDAKPFDGRRVSTGIVGFDAVLGRNEKTGETGLHFPSTGVLGGAQGLGKTALLLESAAAIVRSGVRFAFCSSEQHASAIRAAIIRLGLDDDLRRMNLLCSRDFGEMLTKIREADIRVAFIDSINKFTWPGHDSPRDELTNKVKMMEALIAEVSADEKRYRAFLTISHLNSGDQLSGKREMFYDVDYTAMLTDGSESGYPGTILLECSKNRLAPTKVKAHFRMNDVGKIVEVVHKSPPVESGALIPAPTTVVAPPVDIAVTIAAPLVAPTVEPDEFDEPQKPISDPRFDGLLAGSARRRKEALGSG